MKYTVIIYPTNDIIKGMKTLEEAVNSKIREGYKPLGGVGCAEEDVPFMKFRLFQTMIKE